MLKAEIIGHLGSDVSILGETGHEFAVMRVAHSRKYKDHQGIDHATTTWVDVIVRKDNPCIPYLKKGTQIQARGNVETRVYSSEKDRCMKAGITINATELHLLSSSKNEENTTGKDNKKKYEGF